MKELEQVGILEFQEGTAVLASGLKVLAIAPEENVRYLVSVDVTGLDQEAARAKTTSVWQGFRRLIGPTIPHRHIAVMMERDGRPDVKVYIVKDEP